MAAGGIAMTEFIAEIDANGEIAWVWRRLRGERSARPVSPGVDRFPDLSRAHIFGAPVEKVSDWLRRSGALEAAGH